MKIRVEDLPEGPPGKQEGAQGQALVTWRKDGGPPRQVTVPVGRDVPLTLPIDHGGSNILELAAEPAPRGVAPDNNPRAAAVKGVGGRLRGLPASGGPRSRGR